MRWLTPVPYHTLALLAFLALLSVIFALVTFDLARLGMANAAFLQEHGAMAIMYGGLWQTLGIAGRGAVALMCYIAFKGIEREVVSRWVGD